MFNKKFIIAIVVIFGLLTHASSFAAVNMQEGKWDITLEMKIEGVPFPMPPIKFARCLTKEDMIPQEKKKDQDCRTTSKTKGDTVNWVTVCKDKSGTTESTGSVTYKKGSMNGTMKSTTTDDKGAKSVSNMRVSGKRTGACSK